MKLQEQRAQLREARAAKFQELNSKQEKFAQDHAQSVQQIKAAEEATLLAKLPTWRNSEVAAAEKRSISQALASHYGYQPAEIAELMDHRAVLVARDAAKWVEFQKSKAEKIKQVRDAPPVSKPGAGSGQQGPNEKASFQKFTQDFKRAGQKGNHRAQETSLEKILARTFK